MLKGTMLDTLLNTDVGSGREEVEVAPDTFAMLLLLRGTLVTPETLNRMLVSPQQLLVTIINMLLGIPSLRKLAWPLMEALEVPEALASVDWKTVMTELRHEDVPEEWRQYTMGCLDKDGYTQLEYVMVGEWNIGKPYTIQDYENEREDREDMALAYLDSKFGAKACRRITRFGETALMMAAENRYTKVCQEMLNKFGATGCNLQAVDKFGDTALMKACTDGVEDAAMKMLEFGPEACNLAQANNWDNTALVFACESELEGAVMEMLAFGPKMCNLGQVNNCGFTALTVACMNGWEIGALKMLKCGPEACKLSQVNSNGDTALTMACTSKLEDVVVKMLELGPEACNLNTVNNNGDTALTLACCHGLDRAVMKMLAFGPDACNLQHANGRGKSARDIILDEPAMRAVLDKIDSMVAIESDTDDSSCC